MDAEAPPRGSRARLRRAASTDVDFLLELNRHDDVAPYLAVVQDDREALLEGIERAALEPTRHGRYVVEDERREAVGALAFDCVNEWSAIAQVSGVALLPEARGRRLGEEAARALAALLLGELGYHRLQLECYGYNERAIRLFERVGFRREGIRRAAYWRHERWNDGVLMGLLAEELVGA
jgi:RimJ/RimL family protein N-acetyltransferase